MITERGVMELIYREVYKMLDKTLPEEDRRDDRVLKIDHVPNVELLMDTAVMLRRVSKIYELQQAIKELRDTKVESFSEENLDKPDQV